MTHTLKEESYQTIFQKEQWFRILWKNVPFEHSLLNLPK